VNDLLPKETELKVRYQPLADGEVLGYLHPGQVIECLAVIGDWLQVRFEKEDAAWVRWRITSAEKKTFLGTIFGSADSTSSSALGQHQQQQHHASSKRVTFSGTDSLLRSMSSPFGGFGGQSSGQLSPSGRSRSSSTIATANIPGIFCVLYL
jgi:hypothetical protein